MNIMQIQTKDILILLRYNINTTQSCKKELSSTSTPSIKVKLSTGKPGFNSCRTVQMEKLNQVETTHGLVFVCLESQTKALLNLTLRIYFMLKFVSLAT